MQESEVKDRTGQISEVMQEIEAQDRTAQERKDGEVLQDSEVLDRTGPVK